jgi:hypothetical protein
VYRCYPVSWFPGSTAFIKVTPLYLRISLYFFVFVFTPALNTLLNLLIMRENRNYKQKEMGREWKPYLAFKPLKK